MAANGISTLVTKQAKQEAKLAIAQAKRQGKTVAINGTISGSEDSTKLYYRNTNTLEINDLPTKYSGNTLVTNTHVDGLLTARPWFGHGGSLSFNGTNQYLSVASNTVLPTGNQSYSIEAWIYPTAYASTGAGGGIIGWGPYNVANNINNTLRLTPEGNIYNYWWYNDLISSTTVSLNVWSHVVAQFDGTTRKLFINGTLRGSDTPGSVHAVPSPVTNATVGATLLNTSGWTAERFAGRITNLRVVRGQVVYTGNFTPPTKPLTATQSAGTNIAAITGTATALLLNASSSDTYITDSSSNALVLTNNNTTTFNTAYPF